MTSDGVVIYLVLKGFDALTVVLVASLGSYSGFCSIYLVSYFGREVLLDRVVKIKKSKMEKAEKFFKKYGSLALFFAWLPFIGEAFVAIAGIFKVNFLVFSIMTYVGTLLRFAVIAYIFKYLV
jgi:membrane protein YqaA with SNARE-associated domain